NFGRELPQRIDRFVGEPRTGDYRERVVAMGRDHSVELLCGEANCFIPGCRNQSPAFFISNHGRANSLFMVHERMAKAALDAEELAVQSVHVTIARDNAHQLTTALTQLHLTAV